MLIEHLDQPIARPAVAPHMTKPLIASVTALSALVLHTGAATTYIWPTSVDVARDGSLIVVENGRHRVLRVAGSHTTVLAAGLAKPYEARVDANGTIVLSNAHLLQRLRPGGRPETLARASEDVGPIAVAGARIYYTTSMRLYRLGSRAPLASRLNGPHGLAVTRDGAVLVSDTGHARVLRVTSSGTTTTFAHLREPRGLDVAPDGTVYVVETSSKRVLHLSASGTRLGAVGPRFGDPYDVAVAPHGVLYVVDTAETGRVVRVP